MKADGGTNEPGVAPALVVGRVLVSRLAGQGHSDLSRILRQSAEAWREIGKPILLWAIADRLVSLLTPASQAGLQRTFASLFNYCEAVTLIVPGQDVQRALVRTTLRGMAMTTLGNKTMRVFVVEDLAGAARVAVDPGLPLTELQRAIQRAGILAVPSTVEG